MKILQVLPALNSGGVEKGTLEIAKALVENGHESWVLSSGGRLVTPLCRQGSKHIHWNIGKKSPLTLLQVRRIRRWLDENRFDIVHLRSRMPAWIVWLAWRKMNPATRPRLVSTVHGLHSVSKYSEIVTCGERVITVSQTSLKYVKENYPKTPSDKITLIYRGINPKEFPWQYHPGNTWFRHFFEHYPQLEGKFIITLPGRLSRLKGHHALLDIYPELLKRIPRSRLLIVGDEEPKRRQYAQEIYDRVKENGWQDHVFFTGHRSDMKEIYSLSNVVLSLSQKPESFGRTVLETLSLGTPVVGYDQGGVGEILDALFPFGKCKVGDQSLLVDKLAQLSKKDGAPTPIKNNKFLLETMQAQTLALYQALIDSPRTPFCPS